MRYKSLLVAGVASLALVVPALASASPAHPASPARAAIPLTQYCASGEAQVFLNEPEDRVVAQWNSTDNYFITPQSGHTTFCQKFPKNIGGNTYYEYAAVLNGHETNDCMSLKNGTQKPVGLNGCAAGVTYLLWLPVIQCSQCTPPHYMQSASSGDWLETELLNFPLVVATPQFDDAFDWYTYPG